MSHDYDPSVHQQLMKQMVPCPICMQQFSLLDIEAHSDGCLEQAASRRKPSKAKKSGVVVKAVAEEKWGGVGVSSANKGKVMNIDADLDFVAAMEQVKEQVSRKGNVDATEVVRILEGLRVKYEKENELRMADEDWVKVSYDDVAEEVGGPPTIISKHDLEC